MKNIIQKSCLRYRGSKYELIFQHKINEFIPPTNVNHPYLELFAGSLVMFFNIKTTCAFINDNDDELTNFWIQVQHNRLALEEKLKYIWNGNSFISHIEKEEKTPINRAVLFFLRNRLGTTHMTYPTFIIKQFEIWEEKMNSSRLTILNYDYEKALKIVDQLRNPHSIRAINEKRDLHAVIYADPPYVNSEQIYKNGIFDHQKFAQIIHEYGEIGHHIIISYNKCNEILDLYSDWNIEEFSYSTKTHCANNRIELLISNKKLQRYRYNISKETTLNGLLK